MKDSQYQPPPTQKSWNGGVMSGSNGGGGGGRRTEGSRGGGGQQGGSGGYSHWPPHPIHSHHHHLQSQHSQLPRMMGGYYGGRGLPPAAAHFTWGRPSSGGGGASGSSGLKPPERWPPVVGASASGSAQQAEGGMDLSQSRPNGSQPNGVAKEPVSVIATNPLRTCDKPLEPSDRSEDEDEDCMVIEEGGESPRTGELPPSSRHSAPTRQIEDSPRQSAQMKHQRDPPVGQEAPSLDLPPAAHHNPLRQPSLPTSGSSGAGRPEISHHLPPSVSQPHRSSDGSSSLQMLQKPSSSHVPFDPSQLQTLPSSTSLHKLSRMDASSPHQKPGSPHLPASPLGQKSSSPSLLAQQQVLHQFAQQILAQKQLQDSQQQQSAYQQMLAQQKLLTSNAAAAAEVAHQLLVEQKIQAQAAAVQQMSASKTVHKAHAKPSSPAPPGSHLKMGISSRSEMEGTSVGATHYSGKEPTAASTAHPETLSVPHIGFQQRHESGSIPHLPINIPSSLQVIPHPAGTSHVEVRERLEVSDKTNRQEGLEQRPDIASLPPHVEPDALPRVTGSATPLASLPASPSLPTSSHSQINEEISVNKCAEGRAGVESKVPSSNSTEQRIPCELPAGNLTQRVEGDLAPTPPSVRTPPVVQTPPLVKTPPVAQSPPKVPTPPVAQTPPAALTPPSVQISSVVETPSPPPEPKKEFLPQTVDHVESMLENMFQQDEASTPCRTDIGSLSLLIERRSPALTEDKVVEILQDKEEDVKPEIKLEIKTEPKTEPSTPQKFMQVESELEKMFAGIVETPGDSETHESVSMLSTLKSSNVKKRVRRPRSKKHKDIGGGSSAKKQRNKSPLTAESLRLKRRFGPRAEKIKEGSNDSSSISTDRQLYKCRGPCIKVVGGKDGTPSSVTIVNSSTASNEEDKDRSIDKSLKRKTPRIIEGRTKGPGLYSSTLSSKYNSTTIDVTWTCIFCNRRSHCDNGLGGEPAGDLFGPYLVHIKVEPLMGGPSDADVVSEQRKRGGGKQLSLRAGGKANHSFSPPHKKSRKSSVSDKEGASTGVLCVSNVLESTSGVVSKEVWVHEACAIWAPGVILVGPHLIGLDDAVSLSLHSKCAVCGEAGACISCLQHGCHRVCHYGCARATQWSLDEQTFHARCINHKKPLSMSLALQQSSA